MLITAFIDWVRAQSPLEVIGVITGILCVYLAAKNVIWNWPFAIISVAVYIIIFFEAKLYADMGLQFYFLAMNSYGWYFWSRKSKTEAKVPVVRITKQEILLSIISVIFFTAILGFLLKHGTDAAFPFIDSFCTACSLIAQVLLARKVLENWLIWVFVDVIYVIVYAAKNLNLTADMYALYFVIAALGYRDWRKDHRLQK
ncbi:MAG: nicotinamide riboside transporter PnuC [Janthinobacterium lividum]